MCWRHRSRAVAVLLLATMVVGVAARDDSALQTAKGTVVTSLRSGIMRVYQAKNGNYWFGSSDEGAYRYDGKTITHFSAKDGLTLKRVLEIQEDKAGNIYLSDLGKIAKFDGQSFAELRPSATKSPSEWKLGADDLWFTGAQDQGVVYRYDSTTLHELKLPTTKLGDEHYRKLPRAQFPNAEYSPYDVYCILRDRHGHLWFGTTCVGVCRYDGNTFTWITDADLVEAPVRSIVEDQHGGFWFSYSGQALFEGIRAVQGMQQVGDQIKGSIVSGMCIAEDNDGRIWTAGYGNGVRMHDGKTTKHYAIKEGETIVTLFSISKDRQGDLWLGSHNAGAWKFNGQSFERFRP